jgi:hypothetical protein
MDETLSSVNRYRRASNQGQIMLTCVIHTTSTPPTKRAAFISTPITWGTAIPTGAQLTGYFAHR